MSEEPRRTNHLSGEKSPYLLQHLYNPVDWYPWGEEAFSLARKEDKPIFLSIGYATCHWCHVMERESFEDEETAQLMNETFVNIKVDREELPEVDTLYMEFAQRMMGGSAGWPLNLILTPDLEPFFAATYLPKTNQLGLMGVQELVHKIQEMWQGENRHNLVDQAEQIVALFKEGRQLKGDELPEKSLIDYAIEIFYKIFDPVYGGIRGAPKFPVGYQINFLLSYAVLNQDVRASFLAERTLQMMSQGGLYDHLEGGFFRYSVDEKWLVPHFEKMLYDNAILTDAYLQGWLYTRSNLYAKVVNQTLQFILEEMRNQAGGFNSALDSETEGEEGKFYTWKKEEIEGLLGKDSELFCRYFGVTEKGQLNGRNVLHLPLSLPEFCSMSKLNSKQVEESIKKGKSLLKKVRDTRLKPFKDDKILCSWNGMMIHSMALAGRILEKTSYLEAAVHAANFIYTNMWDGSRLKRRWREGEVLHSSGLDDYAYLIKASLTLFETAGETRWLLFALQLTALLENFYKLEEGAFFQAEKEHQNLIIRYCQFADGAEPSGNSIHCENLLRLYRITLNERYLKQAEDILKAAANFVKAYPPGYSYHLMNLQRYYDEKAPLLVIALNEKEEHAEELQREIFSRYLPHRTLLWKKEGDDKLAELIPSLKEQIPKEGKTTLYLCRQGACLAAASTLEEMRRALRSL